MRAVRKMTGCAGRGLDFLDRPAQKGAPYGTGGIYNGRHMRVASLRSGTRSAVRPASAVAALCAVVFLPGAASSSASEWSVFNFTLDSLTQHEPNRVNLRAVSCPDSSFCVAVGSDGTFATSNQPGAGPSGWGIFGKAP